MKAWYLTAKGAQGPHRKFSLRLMYCLHCYSLKLSRLAQIFRCSVAIQTGICSRQDAKCGSLMSPSGNGRKSLAFRRSLQVDDPLAPPAEAGGLQSR
jgi:hypothetical protein